jgi:hypothetical protein
MGEMIRVSCKSCDFVREADVGVGMMGVGVELCPCYHCRRFVMKKVDFRTDFKGVILKCPYCRKILRPFEEGDRCAICGGSIIHESLGVWD